MLKLNDKNIILQFLIFITLLVGSSLIYLELYNKNQIERSKFSFQINNHFLSDSVLNNLSIDISNHKNILIKNGGNWTEIQLDDYLGFYESISDYLEAKSLNLRDVYDFYAVPIIEAYQSKEIQVYIKSIRDSEKDSEYYEKFEKLALSFEIISKGQH